MLWLEGTLKVTHLIYFLERKKTMTLTAKVGNKTALDQEYILLEKNGIEVYVDTNMDLHVRLKK